MVTFIPALAASLLGAFGVVALLLATVGVGSHGIRLTLIGGVIGLVLALVVMPLASSQLVGVSARDGLTYLIAALCLTVGAAAATYFPARRAAQTDPLRALHYD